MNTKRSYPWEEFWTWAEGRGLAMSTIANRVGSDRRELYRWRDRGSIPEAAADRLALTLGTMPGEIWSSWYDDALAGADAYEAEQKERRRANWRRYIARDPARNDRHNQRRRAAYWANRDAELERQRIYDQGRKDARRAYRERRRLESEGRSGTMRDDHLEREVA